MTTASYETVGDIPLKPRVGTADRKGREFYMAQMAVDILGRTDLDVLVYSAGRSLENHHIATLPNVRSVAISDVIRLRDDAEFFDSGEPATQRFPVVIASDGHRALPRAPDGLRAAVRVRGSPMGYSSARPACTTAATCAGSRTSSRPATPRTTRRRHWSVLATTNGWLVDLRVPLVATGYGGPRKRYVLFTASPAVLESIRGYFQDREYAPSIRPGKTLCRRPTRSDEAREQLVREQPAAGREHDPIVGRDVEQLGRESPAEDVGERRLLGRGERDAACRGAGRG